MQKTLSATELQGRDDLLVSLVSDTGTERVEPKAIASLFEAPPVAGTLIDLVRFSGFTNTSDTNISEAENLQLYHFNDTDPGATQHINTHGITFATTAPYQPSIPKNGYYEIDFKLNYNLEDGNDQARAVLFKNGTVVDEAAFSVRDENGARGQQTTVSYKGNLTTTDVLNIQTLDLANDVAVPSMYCSINERSLIIGSAPASAAVIPTAILRNVQQTNLNSTVGGNPFQFDVNSFEGDPEFEATATGLRVLEDGTYTAKLKHYGTVPSNGTQRAGVSIKLLVDNAQQIDIGTSYIRRNNGNDEGDAHVEDRLILSAGEIVGGLGFRDGAAGVVTSPAGLSKLFLTKTA